MEGMSRRVTNLEGALIFLLQVHRIILDLLLEDVPPGRITLLVFPKNPPGKKIRGLQRWFPLAGDMVDMQRRLWIEAPLERPNDVPIKLGDFRGALAPVDQQLHAVIRPLKWNLIEDQPRDEVIDAILLSRQPLEDPPFVQGQGIHVKPQRRNLIVEVPL